VFSAPFERKRGAAVPTPNQSERFRDKVAIVTGGASGIGLSIARRFLLEGGRVVAGDLAIESLVALQRELGPDFIGVETDVRMESEVAHMIERAVESFGSVDVGFNAAAFVEGQSIVEQTSEMWRGQLDVLLTGVFHCVKHEGRQMMSQEGGGSIVNISSVQAQVPAPGASAYCSAKAGVEMLTKAAAIEMAQNGIRVNAVAPGIVNTPLSARTGNMEPHVVSQWIEHTPLRRVGQPEDIAAAALFLASHEASWITGTTLVVDGGAVMTAYPEIKLDLSDTGKI
jgi:NAD(P)-dependent dehydrogenase (short-subunit alcohol dehydrogenase family)